MCLGVAEWNKQIERDSEAGKLDFLIKEALGAKAKGQVQDLQMHHF